VILLANVLVAFASDEDTVTTKMSEATNEFSINLAKKIFSEENKNVVTSPVSVSTLLALVLQGASGEVKKELETVLHCEAGQMREEYRKLLQNIKNSKDNATVEFANAMFVKNDVNLKETFKNIARNDFLSESISVNFDNPSNAANIMNSWAESHTHGKIKNIISEDMINSDTEMFLTNAIYFKSYWENSFPTKSTKNQTFHSRNQGKVTVPMMFQERHMCVGNIPELDARWVNIPYKGNRYSFLVVMPTEINGFDNLETRFNFQHFLNIINTKGIKKPKVHLYLPKFKVSSNLDKLQTTLAQMGLHETLSKGTISEMSERPITVSDVIQKAVIEIDEKGSEAAAENR
ncbi:hypothetical protein L9F63_014215, partial [Diploptera punctata]